MKYGVNIFVLVDAEDVDHLKDILFKLINAKLPDSIARNIKHMEYDSEVTIHNEDGDAIDLIII